MLLFRKALIVSNINLVLELQVEKKISDQACYTIHGHFIQ